MINVANRLKFPFTKIITISVLVGCLSALAWQLTMAGTTTATYTPGQIFGCAAIVVIGTTLGTLLLQKHWYLLPFAAAIGVALPFARKVSAADSTGLWPVGVGLVFIGVTTGLTAVCFAVVKAVEFRRRW